MRYAFMQFSIDFELEILVSGLFVLLPLTMLILVYKRGTLMVVLTLKVFGLLGLDLKKDKCFMPVP